jgi:GMP synthase-like glutamine amidotransferase
MWHGDTFDLPEAARAVARTALGPQAYTLGPHVCVQFHPEVDASVVGGWMDHDPTDFLEAGLSVDDVLAETARREDEARRRAAALVDRFLERSTDPR